MHSKIRRNILISFILLLVGVASRIVPHAPNLTALGAIAIIAGVYLPKTYAISLLTIILVLSDAIIGFHSTMPWVYGSYALIALLSQRLASRKLLIMPIMSSLLFFVITNFGVWVSTSMYAKTIDGLIRCYVMGIPFLRGTLTGDIVYTSLFIVIVEVISAYHAQIDRTLARIPSLYGSNK